VTAKNDATDLEWSKDLDFLRTSSKGLGEETYPFLVDGQTPKAGDFFSNPALGSTLRKIGKLGAKGFYEGEVAQAIVDSLSSRGGKMTLDDLAAYEAELVESISYTYGKARHTIWECPPNG
jgi:gamma-glutamyltranspeptidase/glutathione hydrolase